MWKGVILLDVRTSNVQGKSPLFRNFICHGYSRITPAGTPHQYGSLYNVSSSGIHYARDVPEHPTLHGFISKVNDTCTARTSASNTYGRYATYKCRETVMYGCTGYIGLGLSKEPYLRLAVPGMNRVSYAQTKNMDIQDNSSDGIHHLTGIGTSTHGIKEQHGSSLGKGGNAYSVRRICDPRGLATCDYHWHWSYVSLSAPYGIGLGVFSRRSFSFFGGIRKKDTNKATCAPAPKGSDMPGVSKRHDGKHGLIRLSLSVVKWVVILPFRLGKWAIHFLSLTVRMVTHLMRISARAAVVARVSGVSGIFKSLVDGVKHTIHWCKTGFRLYFANVKVSYYILLKRLKGHPMRYNERKLLMKTLNDALKMLPFSFFIIVPFAEFLLPVAIRLFPQMLPSTFRTDNSKSDDYLQKKLLAKRELAQFFQELVQERTNQILQEELDASLKTKMEALKDFQERILNKEDVDVNPFLSSNELLVFAKIFKKEFKLDQMNLETLKVMCKLLGITPFSMRSHVVLQLRHHLLKIQREDRLILWEGVDSLSTEELQEACRDRAMKFYNVTKEQLQQQLKQWLDLSSMPEISPILLLWSRCITMTHEPMAIKADEEGKSQADVEEALTFDSEAEAADKHAQVPVKSAKKAEKFAEEVTTAQKASSRPIVQAVTAAAEVDAQKLLNREERLEELSLKAEELKGIILGNIQESEDEETVDKATPFDDTKPEELIMDMHSSEERFMQLKHGDHVILHTHEINKLSPLSKQEILIRHEELLSALHLQRQISDIQHNQLTEMFMYLLKVSEEASEGKEVDFKDRINDLVKAARQDMAKIEELTYQFDKHNLTYE